MRYTFYFTCGNDKAEIKANDFDSALTRAFEDMNPASIEDIKLEKYDIHYEQAIAASLEAKVEKEKKRIDAKNKAKDEEMRRRKF